MNTAVVRSLAPLAIALLLGQRLAAAPPASVAGWGSGAGGGLDLPPRLTNVVAIAANQGYGLALGDDGRVTSIPADPFAQFPGRVAIPADLTDAVAISAGFRHGLALTASGTVAAWGVDSS
jgi:hypothetical protein